MLPVINYLISERDIWLNEITSIIESDRWINIIVFDYKIDYHESVILANSWFKQTLHYLKCKHKKELMNRNLNEPFSSARPVEKKKRN
jgi:predicted AlkP superfamily phosphohydrolase/phosphomutase